MNRASVVERLAIDRARRFSADLRPHPVELGQRRNVERIDVRHVLHEFALDELVHQFVAEPFDVHREARRKMPDRFLALRRAIEPAGAARHCFVVSAVDVGTAHRARVGISIAAASPGVSAGPLSSPAE